MLQELVGPRPNRAKNIQNGRHVNKGKMHKITISSTVRALVGNLVQQNGEVKNSRLII